jgi:hypothetical protein
MMTKNRKYFTLTTKIKHFHQKLPSYWAFMKDSSQVKPPAFKRDQASSSKPISSIFFFVAFLPP